MSHTLLLLRHAKAADLASGRTDHQRPLTEWGEQQAIAVGQRLRSSGLTVDLALCSTARRTRETLAGLGLGDLPVELDDRVYEAGVDTLTELIQAVPEQVQTLLLIGHAPAVPALAADLAGPGSAPGAVIELNRRFPTATMARIELDREWAGSGAGRLQELYLTE